MDVSLIVTLVLIVAAAGGAAVVMVGRHRRRRATKPHRPGERTGAEELLRSGESDSDGGSRNGPIDVLGPGGNGGRG